MLEKIGNKEDLRVRKTRRLLQEKFWELLAEKSFLSITVQDIAEKAMVNRTTFYDHFIDKYALLQYSIHEWFRETLQSQPFSPAEDSLENLPGLIATTCEFLAKLRYHCLPRDNQILPLVQTTITGLIAETLASWVEKGRPDVPPNLPLATAATSWTIYGAAFYWSQEEKRETAYDFSLRILPAIQASLESLIAAPSKA